MKNILLLIHEDEGQEARLQAALDVTRALDGHLNCIDVTVLSQIVPEYYPAVGVAAVIANERQRESENGQRIRARLETELVQWSWTDATGYPLPAIEAAADLADLIVLNRRPDTLTIPDIGSVAAVAIVKTGKPVLAVPEDGRGFQAAGVALVAWDGSSQASAALQAAVPLLRLAKSVLVFEIDDGSIRIPGEEAASYLSRHDIHAVVRQRFDGRGGIADMLLDEAKAIAADYVVMGGFGHGRLIEAVCGGVTERMLAKSPVPLLLVH